MNLNELEDNTYKITSAHDFHDNKLRKELKDDTHYW